MSKLPNLKKVKPLTPNVIRVSQVFWSLYLDMGNLLKLPVIGKGKL